MNAVIKSTPGVHGAMRYFAAGLVLLLGAAWLVAHPHMGLWHDARLYAVEALARLAPGVYDRDLFLAFGSQGKYTLFPPLFAGLIDWLGLERATLVLALLGKLFWFASLVLLTRQLVPAPGWLLGLVFVLAYPAFYDSHKIFSYAESFATPRIYAEALCMLALTAWAQSRRLWAWVLVGVAGLLHPLMAIPVAAVLGVLAWIAARDSGRAWALPVAGSLAGAGVLLAMPELRERLLSVYDATWLEAVRLRNPYVFLDQWDEAAFGRMSWVAAVLGVAAMRLRGRGGTLAWALLLAATGLVVLSWVGTSVWQNILLTQLQLWRVMWLAQLVALMLLGGLLLELWRSDYPDKILAASLVAAALAEGGSAAFIAAAGVLLVLAFRRAGVRIDTASSLWRALPFLLVLPGTVAHLAAMPYWVLANEVFMEKAVWRTWLGDGAVMLALAAVVYWLARHTGPRVAKLLVAVGVVALLLAAASWSPAAAYANRPEDEAVYERLRKDIPPGSLVAGGLSGMPQALWFQLRRASYASQVQTAGALFSRDTAAEGVRRLALMHKSGFPHSQPTWLEDESEPAPELSARSARDLCLDPFLDFVLLAGKWDGAVHYSMRGRVAMSLYACRDFRKQGAVP